MVEAITIKTPEGETVPFLTAEEVAELEKLNEEMEPKLGLENDEEENNPLPIKT